MILKIDSCSSFINMSPAYESKKISWRFWGIWALILSVVSIVYLVPILNAPLFHADLFINIDLGRIFLNPETDWAITWKTIESQPVYLINYVGIVLQEYFYQLVGLVGPVIFTLAGALFASTMVLKRILLSNVSKNVALIISLVFLLDPVFVQSYTIGRLDSWVIGFCISVCYLLRNSIGNPKFKPSQQRNRVAISGGIFVVAFFTWPSAVFLFPLILCELISISSFNKTEMEYRKDIGYIFGYFSLGGIIALILLFIPVYLQIFSQFEEILNTWQVNLQNEQVASDQVFYSRYFESSIEVLRVLKFSPFLPLFAILGVIKKRKIGLLIAFVITISLMIVTVVYIQRVLYLLPYFIIMSTYMFQVNNVNKSFTFQVVQTLALGISIIWSVGLSIGVYSFFSIKKIADNEKELFYKTGESMLAASNPKVLTPYEFYSFGRSKGWKMYSPYTALGTEKFSFEEMEAQLPVVDYAILSSISLTEGLTNQLIQEGLLYRGEFSLYENPSPPFDGKTTNTTRLRNLYHIYEQSYGPYHLFSREKK